MLERIKEIDILTDNQEVREKIKERLESLKKELFISHACVQTLRDGFQSQTFARTAVDAELDFLKTPVSALSRKRTPQNISQPELFRLLDQWRADTADMERIERYQVMPTRTILEIVEVLPTLSSSLKRIHGIGKARIVNYGEDLLLMVSAYSEEKKLETDRLSLASKAPKKPKAPKTDSKAISLELFRKGKDIGKVAKERELALSTIESHLSHYVKSGDLDVLELLDSEKVEKIVSFFRKSETVSLNEAKSHFGNAYSYGELKMVKAHLEGEAIAG